MEVKEAKEVRKGKEKVGEEKEKEKKRKLKIIPWWEHPELEEPPPQAYGYPW